MEAEARRAKYALTFARRYEEVRQAKQARDKRLSRFAKLLDVIDEPQIEKLYKYMINIPTSVSKL
jgi:hypothetical protein